MNASAPPACSQIWDPFAGTLDSRSGLVPRTRGFPRYPLQSSAPPSAALAITCLWTQEPEGVHRGARSSEPPRAALRPVSGGRAGSGLPEPGAAPRAVPDGGPV